MESYIDWLHAQVPHNFVWEYQRTYVRSVWTEWLQRYVAGMGAR